MVPLILRLTGRVFDRAPMALSRGKMPLGTLPNKLWASTRMMGSRSQVRTGQSMKKIAELNFDQHANTHGSCCRGNHVWGFTFVDEPQVANMGKNGARREIELLRRSWTTWSSGKSSWSLSMMLWVRWPPDWHFAKEPQFKSEIQAEMQLDWPKNSPNMPNPSFCSSGHVEHPCCTLNDPQVACSTGCQATPASLAQRFFWWSRRIGGRKRSPCSSCSMKCRMDKATCLRAGFFEFKKWEKKRVLHMFLGTVSTFGQTLVHWCQGQIHMSVICQKGQKSAADPTPNQEQNRWYIGRCYSSERCYKMLFLFPLDKLLFKHDKHAIKLPFKSCKFSLPASTTSLLHKAAEHWFWVWRCALSWLLSKRFWLCKTVVVDQKLSGRTCFGMGAMLQRVFGHLPSHVQTAKMRTITLHTTPGAKLPFQKWSKVQG